MTDSEKAILKSCVAFLESVDTLLGNETYVGYKNIWMAKENIDEAIDHINGML